MHVLAFAELSITIELLHHISVFFPLRDASDCTRVLIWGLQVPCSEQWRRPPEASSGKGKRAISPSPLPPLQLQQVAGGLVDVWSVSAANEKSVFCPL